MAAWEVIEFPASLIDLLMPVDRQENAVRSIEFDPHPFQLPKIVSKTAIALVEALFLESRKPIVLFEKFVPQQRKSKGRLIGSFILAKHAQRIQRQETWRIVLKDMFRRYRSPGVAADLLAGR